MTRSLDHHLALGICDHISRRSQQNIRIADLTRRTLQRDLACADGDHRIAVRSVSIHCVGINPDRVVRIEIRDPIISVALDIYKHFGIRRPRQHVITQVAFDRRFRTAVDDRVIARAPVEVRIVSAVDDRIIARAAVGMNARCLTDDRIVARARVNARASRDAADIDRIIACLAVDHLIQTVGGDRIVACARVERQALTRRRQQFSRRRSVECCVVRESIRLQTVKRIGRLLCEISKEHVARRIVIRIAGTVIADVEVS